MLTLFCGERGQGTESDKCGRPVLHREAHALHLHEGFSDPWEPMESLDQNKGTKSLLY